MMGLRQSCRVAQAGMTQTMKSQRLRLTADFLTCVPGQTHWNFQVVPEVSPEVTATLDSKICSRLAWRKLAKKGNEHYEMGRQSHNSYDSLVREVAGDAPTEN